MKRRVESFEGGSLRHHYKEWENITSDKEILQTVSGLRIELRDIPEHQSGNFPQDVKSEDLITEEIEKLLKKKVIELTHHEIGEFISPTFITNKPDGGNRFILNLKKLNKEIEKKKFKMQTLKSILCLIRPKAFMSKLDIKDAYYSVPIHKNSVKLLKFEHKGQLFQFIALPNGYTEGPRKFTKLMKPPLAVLRKQAVSLADYIDDLFTIGKTYSICSSNVDKIIELLDSLGFVIHPDKSLFEPSQNMEFLGFIINTVDMSLRLTPNKEITIIELCSCILDSVTVSIRTLAKLLGKFASSFMAVPFGRLHYRALERHKTESLRIHKGKFDRKIVLSKDARNDILWWKHNIKGSWSPIIRDNPKIEMTTDASTIGWGAVIKEISTGGQFTILEREQHINVLELKAALFGLQALCHNVYNTHILLKVDNTSAVASINKMGSTRSLMMDRVVLGNGP